MQNTVEPPPYHKYHGVSNEQVKSYTWYCEKNIWITMILSSKILIVKAIVLDDKFYEVEIIRLPENRKNGITLEYELLIDYTNKTVISDKIDY